MARALPAEAHAGHLRQRFPSAHCEVVAGELRWRGALRPTLLSREYIVRIVYKNGSVSCHVVHPKLERRGDEPPPHLYPGERLCLHLPKAFEWDGSQPIATTIVPWVSEWLAFYELWLATGEWLGGGTHPKKS